MSLLATLGLRPDGDPPAMRAFAAQLRAAADQIATSGDGAPAAIERATFDGPAGEATLFRARRLRERTTSRAVALRALADAIAERAGRVEQGQHAWDGLKHRIELEARRLGNP